MVCLAVYTNGTFLADPCQVLERRTPVELRQEINLPNATKHTESQRIFTCEVTGHGGLTYEEARQSETFEHEFFPNEMVVWAPQGATKVDARIREKTSFPEIKNPDGSISRPATARYFVELLQGGDALLARTDELSRQRRHFNKTVIRQFVKNSVHPRESWTGAPWIVKEDIARNFHIPTDVPANLRHDAVLEEKKKSALAQRTAQHEDFIQELANEGKLPGISSGTVLNAEQLSHFYGMFIATQNDKNGKGIGRMANGGKTSVFQASLPKAMKPEPLKFPCDDLEIPIKKRNAVSRPQLKFLTSDTPSLAYVRLDSDPQPLTGDLLQIWHTLNVFAPLFVLDSFTFDDLVQALAIWNWDQPCELFSEIHCAVLKVIVDRTGELQVKSLVEVPSRYSEWETYLAPDAESSSETEDTVQIGVAATNEGPLTTVDKARILKAFPAPEDWTRRVGECLFQNDTWQFLMIGLLAQIATKSHEFRSICEELLAKLMPTEEDLDLTETSTRDLYAALDLASRVKILQLAMLHVPDTKGVRSFMEDCDREATETRKKKISWQSKKKPLVKEWQELDQQRKLLRPDASNSLDDQPIPAAIENDDTDADSDAEQVDDGKANDEDSESEEDITMLSRSSGRASMLKRKREEEAAEKELQKKVKVDLDDNTKYEKVLEEMATKAEDIKECEEEIKLHDNALRENACHRARKLGTDRYLNHYYWYERNGMAFGGDEDSSTADHGYANGCIWIQGPDELQAQNVVYLNAEQSEKYAKRTGIDITERRKRDEGKTQLQDANHWGFIDNPDDLDKLIAYLDERGRDEKALRKELKNWRGEIAHRMVKRQERMQRDEAIQDDDEEPVAVGVATRRKQEANRAEGRYSCLQWWNSMAANELGRLHSEGKRGKPGPKPKGSRQKQAAAAVVKELTTRSGRRR
ncbi:hypothetical protein FH972_023475 [Carpinus fangiana]|uniref:DDT domain-containing protein n=1 Tax=Carpinus fangiana TaxID=176857 RepID=A0A5N6KVS2_9ROSI|nr:hypothetical protein FH972_023475 [Carpinus fangiana]